VLPTCNGIHEVVAPSTRSGRLRSLVEADRPHKNAEGMPRERFGQTVGRPIPGGPARSDSESGTFHTLPGPRRGGAMAAAEKLTISPLIDPAHYAAHGYPHELWTRLRREDPVHRVE